MGSFFASLYGDWTFIQHKQLRGFTECDKPDRAGELKFSETKVNCFHKLEHLRKEIKTQMYNRSSFPYTASTERLSQLVTWYGLGEKPDIKVTLHLISQYVCSAWLLNQKESDSWRHKPCSCLFFFLCCSGLCSAAVCMALSRDRC